MLMLTNSRAKASASPNMSLADIPFADFPQHSDSCKHLPPVATSALRSYYINKLIYSSAHGRASGEGNLMGLTKNQAQVLDFIQARMPWPGQALDYFAIEA